MIRRDERWVFFFEGTEDSRDEQSLLWRSMNGA